MQISQQFARFAAKIPSISTNSISFTKLYKNETFFDYFPYIKRLSISLPVNKQIRAQRPVEGGYYLSELNITGTLE